MTTFWIIYAIGFVLVLLLSVTFYLTDYRYFQTEFSNAALLIILLISLVPLMNLLVAIICGIMAISDAIKNSDAIQDWLNRNPFEKRHYTKTHK